MGDVLTYPTTRKARYKQPAGAHWWRNPEFADVPRLHRKRAPAESAPDAPEVDRSWSGGDQTLVLTVALLAAVQRHNPELFDLVRDALDAGSLRHPWDAGFINARGIFKAISRSGGPL